MTSELVPITDVKDLEVVEAEVIPIDQHPAAIYLARLTSESSRMTMRSALETIARLASNNEMDLRSFAWHRLRYQHCQAIRAQLQMRFRNAKTVNKHLSALRGVLKEAWRLGLIPTEDYSRTADVRGVKGETLLRGSALTSGELKAAYTDHVWSYDFMHARTHDGRPLRLLNIIDEYSRECLSIDVARKLNSEDVLDRLAHLFVLRGVPAYLRSDNGPEFIAKKVRDWLESIGVRTLYIEPGSPWENDYLESFNGKLRDELLNREIFYTVMEAKVLVVRSGRIAH